MWQEKVPRTRTSSAHICQHQTHDEQLTYFWIPRGGKKRILDVYGIKKKKKPPTWEGWDDVQAVQGQPPPPYGSFFSLSTLPIPNTSNPSIPVKLHSRTKLNVCVVVGRRWGRGMALGESKVR